MAVPYVIAANGLAQIITTEFLAQGVVPIHDELHESLGEDGRIVSISIDREAPGARNRVGQEVFLRVQWFEKWTKEVDNAIVHDPRTIATLANRLQRAIAAANLTYSGDFWFFNWEGTEYPRDPTGNKTRFIMSVKAWGNNAGLVETTG
jgi:hypothetical protein